MAQLPVEEALLREPNLWSPQKKPVGPVRVDWSLHVTSELVVCSYLEKQTYVGNITNFADHNNPAVISGTATTVNPYGFDAKGSYATIHPSGRTFGLDDIKYTKDDVVAPTDDITVISSMAPLSSFNGWSNQHGFFHLGVGSDSVRLSYTSTTNLQGTYIDSSPVAGHDINLTIPTIGLEVFATASLRKKGNELQIFYLDDNNAFLSSGVTTGGSGDMRDDGNGNHMSPHNAAEPNKGHEYWRYLFVWKRSLSDSEIISIMRDPYQFLIPA